MSNLGGSLHIQGGSFSIAQLFFTSFFGQDLSGRFEDEPLTKEVIQDTTDELIEYFGEIFIEG